MEQVQKTKGKRKIAMEQIESKNKRQVTFSKRRYGLFKKASELSVTCGAQVAVITFSIAGKAFSFGHPFTPDELIDRFVSRRCENNDGGAIKMGASSNDHHQQQQCSYNKCVTNTDAVKKEGNNNDGLFWWDKSVDDLGLMELEKFNAELEGLRNQIVSKLENKISRTNQSVLSNMGSVVDDVDNYCAALTQPSYNNDEHEQSFDTDDGIKDYSSSKLDSEISANQTSMASSGDFDFDFDCFMDENNIADQASLDGWKSINDTEDYGLSGESLLNMLLNGY